MQSRFESKKKRILDQISVPDEEYTDLSPKGSIDEPIRPLIRDINSHGGLVTTSSCSGRISVFLEGRKKAMGDADDILESEEIRAGPGGKGGGGSWLFISHDPVDAPEATSDMHFMNLFGLQSSLPEIEEPPVHSRFIHLKFEPMVCLQRTPFHFPADIGRSFIYYAHRWKPPSKSSQSLWALDFAKAEP